MANNLNEQNWLLSLRKEFSEKFLNASVLDIGSANINGTNKPFLSQAGCSEYIGLDVAPYNNVDIVSIAHEYNPGRLFDIVCSTSALEHDMYWEKTLRKMVQLLKPGGLMFFTCCSNWEEHGTLKFDPQNSLTSQIPGWENYYRNLKPEDIKRVLNLKKLFSKYKLEVDPDTNIDLHFWGVKK